MNPLVVAYPLLPLDQRRVVYSRLLADLIVETGDFLVAWQVRPGDAS